MKKEAVEINGVRWEALAVVADHILGLRTRIEELEFALACENARYEGRTELAQRLGEDTGRYQDSIERIKALCDAVLIQQKC